MTIILVLLFYNLSLGNQSLSNTGLILLILELTGPFLIMLGVVGFVSYMLISYKNIIINDRVAPSYKAFNNITLLLLLLGMCIVMSNMSNEKFKSTGKLSLISSSLLYLLGLLEIISSLIIYVLLKYYTTDG